MITDCIIKYLRTYSYFVNYLVKCTQRQTNIRDWECINSMDDGPEIAQLINSMDDGSEMAQLITVDDILCHPLGRSLFCTEFMARLDFFLFSIPE